MAPKTRRAVFVSSTVEDLIPYRDAATEAVNGAGHVPIRSEYFVASDQHPPCEACMEKVDEADVLAVIVAHRYGWVPKDQPNEGELSITWLECLRAEGAGKEVLAFVLDDKPDWPLEQKEEYGFIAAGKGEAEALTIDEVRRNVAKLAEFKQWLNNRAIWATFTSPEDLRGKLSDAIGNWEKRYRKRRKPAVTHPRKKIEPTHYLQVLRDACGYIDIRGLEVGSGRAHRFPIDDLYVPLTTTQTAEEQGTKNKKARADDTGMESRTRVELEEALQKPRLVIVGAPGAGKTTFLRRVAHELALARLETDPKATQNRLGLKDAPFPIYIRLGDLTEHRTQCRERKEGPALPESPAWLLHFLAAQSKERGWGLDEKFFREVLRKGTAIVLLDGLDEAPDREERESVAQMFEKVVEDHGSSRFVVTTRPRAYEGLAVLTDFAEVRIEPLEPEAMETFLQQWSKGLFPHSERDAEEHRSELAAALDAKPEIRHMARNPVMLTALAALYWNDKCLPDQRAELYDSILKWLLRSRRQRPGRAGEKVVRRRLSRVALAMQAHPKGRQTQVPRRWAAEAIVDDFGGDADAADTFLAEEEIDSGVISSVGRDIRFWHLTFQEYLGARAVGEKADLKAQLAELTEDDRLYQPEWREVLLLFGGVLHEQGRDKVDAFVKAVLSRPGEDPTLAERARCIGLLGAMVRDLSPLEYEPGDPAYRATLDAVMDIFDAENSESVLFQDRLDAAEALGQAGDPRLDEDNWVAIPAGTFPMGSEDEEAYDDEKPVHEVELDAFQIGRYPVTVQEFARFVADGGYQEPRWWKHPEGFGQHEQPEKWDEQANQSNHPVTGVSWYEAAAYCEWLSERLGARVRLPTEAEWERAACGGEPRKYPWGDGIDPSRANYYHDDAPKRTTPVGLYPRGASLEGLHDMAGNVWEWCADWFKEDYYGDSLRVNPTGPSEGNARVVRGGSWVYDPRYVRSSVRDRYEPGDRSNDLGFRCAGEVFP